MNRTDSAARMAAYLARIGLDRAPAPDPHGLALLQAAQRMAIPFENLDIPLGRGIAVDSDSVFDKLVEAKRGGYCFEQNRLYADMLGLLGLPTRPLLARGLLGPLAAEPPPRTHVLLLAEIAGAPWILDAGFGGAYVPPLRLAEGEEIATPDGARHRLVKSGERGSLAGEWRLDRAGPSGATDGRAADTGVWQAQYCFDLAEVAPLDLEQANHWTATHPKSRFVGAQIVSRVLADGFASLVGSAFKLHTGGATQERELGSPGEYRAVLRDIFTLRLTEEEVARLPLFVAML